MTDVLMQVARARGRKDTPRLGAVSGFVCGGKEGVLLVLGWRLWVGVMGVVMVMVMVMVMVCGCVGGGSQSIDFLDGDLWLLSFGAVSLSALFLLHSWIYWGVEFGRRCYVCKYVDGQ